MYVTLDKLWVQTYVDTTTGNPKRITSFNRPKIDRNDIALVVNSVEYRSQWQYHIHVAKLTDEAKFCIQTWQPTWKQFTQANDCKLYDPPHAGLNGKFVYAKMIVIRVRLINGSLKGSSTFPKYASDIIHDGLNSVLWKNQFKGLKTKPRINSGVLVVPVPKTTNAFFIALFTDKNGGKDTVGDYEILKDA